MSNRSDDPASRRWKAPDRDGDALIDPPNEDWPATWQRNLELLGNYPQPLSEWRAKARPEILNAAKQYTSAYSNVHSAVADADHLILAGHQPTLFHPGVWFKNFFLDHLSRKIGARSLQLIIDNDLFRQASIRLPAGSIAHPAIAYCEFDRPSRAVPFETARLNDEKLFQSFGDRVAKSMAPFVSAPLIKDYWASVIRQYRRVANIGLAFSSARHQFESAFGSQTLELPLSSVCQTDTFRHFVAHVLCRSEDFARFHNDALAEFRRRRRLRSENHPVPNLSMVAGEIETPFWIWEKSSPIRRRLYVRKLVRDIALTDRHQFERRVSVGAGLVEQLESFEKAGIAIRPRALMTTMFARTVLSDLFVHGIGGATYDVVTDEIIRGFFQVEPSRFVTATATVHLPIPCPAVDERDLAQVDFELRDAEFHPERYLSQADSSVAALVREKQFWIARGSSNGSLKPRHDAIANLNRQLYSRLANRITDLRRLREQLHLDLQRKKILASREYSFVLFPELLIDQLRALSASANASTRAQQELVQKTTNTVA